MENRYFAFIIFALLFAVNVHAAPPTPQYLDQVALLSNTYSCGGEVRCEAYIELPGYVERGLGDANAPVFDLDYLNGKASGYKIDFEIGHYETQAVTVSDPSCTDHLIENGSVVLECSLVSRTEHKKVLVWHGQKIVPGRNVLHIWSDEKPKSETVDWNFRLPVRKTDGSDFTFDTRAKGWALWSTLTSTPVFNANNKTDWTNGGAQGLQYIYGERITILTAGSTVTTIGLDPISNASWVWIFNNSATPVIIGALQVTSGTTATGSVVLPYAGTYYFQPGKNTSTWVDRYNTSSSPIVDNALNWNGSGYFDCTGNAGRAIGSTCGAFSLDGAGGRRNIRNITLLVPVTGNFTPLYQRQVYVYWNSTNQTNGSQIITNKSIVIVVANATFNNSANPDFSDVRVKMVNSSGNDVVWDYKLSFTNTTHANITFTVSTDTLGNFNSGQQYYFVWGNATTSLTTSNGSLFTNFTGAPTNWTFGSVTAYAEGNDASANESVGRTAILAGVASSEVSASYTSYSDHQLYIRLANGSQYNGRFDLFVTSGTKRWAFNYDNASASGFPTFANITPVLWTWQKTNLTATNIAADVNTFINSTN